MINSGNPPTSGAASSPGSSAGHHDEAHNHGFLVAVPVDEHSTRIAEYEVRGKEGQLLRHSLCIVERKNALQVRDDDVVQAGQEADHEEKRGREGHGARIGLHGHVVGIAGRADIAEWQGQVELLREKTAPLGAKIRARPE